MESNPQINQPRKQLINIDHLEKILEKCWTEETSLDSENWIPENPSWGQCAVTACIVNDYFGGKIVWTNVNMNGQDISHYFNNIEGKEIDLTRKQFPPGTTVLPGIDKTKNFPTTRDYVLSYEKTLARYRILKARVDEQIAREYNANS